MREIIFGTGNTAKLSAMKKCLLPLGIKVVGIYELENTEIPKVTETGNTPLENARQKANAYYNLLKRPVFSCDDGLYFENMPDEIQPGVHVRTVNGKYLSDDEMIEYYSSLAEKYGDITAQYRRGICVVIDENTVYESMDISLAGEKFIITSKPHKKRNKGFPLDSLSKDIKTGKYFVDIETSENAVTYDGFPEFFSDIKERITTPNS